MPVRFDIGDKKSKKTFHYEAEADLSGKKLGEKIEGKELGTEFAGYEFEITGASDKAGFPSMKNVDGSGLRKVLLKRGFSMHRKDKGLRVRKTVCGNTISADIMQINLKVVKEGKNSIAKILGKEESGKVLETKEVSIEEAPAEKAEEK